MSQAKDKSTGKDVPRETRAFDVATQSWHTDVQPVLRKLKDKKGFVVENLKNNTRLTLKKLTVDMALLCLWEVYHCTTPIRNMDKFIIKIARQKCSEWGRDDLDSD